MVRFNSIIISNNDPDIAELMRLVARLKFFDIRNVIITCGADMSVDFDCHITNRLKNLSAAATSMKVFGVNMIFAVNFLLTPGLLNESAFEKRLYGGSNAFLQIPLFASSDWIHHDLSILIHKRKIKPIFTCFDKNIITCSSEYANKLYKTRSSAFCLDLNYMAYSKDFDFIDRVIKQGQPILPCISGPVSGYIEVDEIFRKLESKLTSNVAKSFYKEVNKHIYSTLGLV